MVVAEGAGRLAPARGERVDEGLAALDQPHPLAAAAGDRLDEYGIADFVRLGLEERGLLVLAHVARRHRNPGRRHQPLGRVLEAHGGDRRRLGPDPDEAGVDHRLREFGILRQEAVAGMDRLGPGRPGRGNDSLADEVTLARRRGADMHGLVGLLHVQRPRIGIRIDRDGTNAEPPRGPDDPAGDLAAVGDEEGSDHGSFLDPSRDRLGEGDRPALAGWWRGREASAGALLVGEAPTPPSALRAATSPFRGGSRGDAFPITS